MKIELNRAVELNDQDLNKLFYTALIYEAQKALSIGTAHAHFSTVPAVPENFFTEEQLKHIQDRLNKMATYPSMSSAPPMSPMMGFPQMQMPDFRGANFQQPAGYGHNPNFMAMRGMPPKVWYGSFPPVSGKDIGNYLTLEEGDVRIHSKEVKLEDATHVNFQAALKDFADDFIRQVEMSPSLIGGEKLAIRIAMTADVEDSAERPEKIMPVRVGKGPFSDSGERNILSLEDGDVRIFDRRVCMDNITIATLKEKLTEYVADFVRQAEIFPPSPAGRPFTLRVVTVADTKDDGS